MDARVELIRSGKLFTSGFVKNAENESFVNNNDDS